MTRHEDTVCMYVCVYCMYDKDDDDDDDDDGKKRLGLILLQSIQDNKQVKRKKGVDKTGLPDHKPNQIGCSRARRTQETHKKRKGDISTICNGVVNG